MSASTTRLLIYLLKSNPTSADRREAVVGDDGLPLVRISDARPANREAARNERPRLCLRSSRRASTSSRSALGW